MIVGQALRKQHSSMYWTLIFAIMVCLVLYSPAPSEPLRSSLTDDEPITPIPDAPPGDELKIRLGEELFESPLLSRDNNKSCSSCHSLGSNGATANALDTAIDGQYLKLNTPTVFNSSLNFRWGWEGSFRTLEDQARESLESTAMMGSNARDVVAKLKADPAITKRFQAVYGHEPDVPSLLDAIATFERSLVTPGSRFDQWLAGDKTALTTAEQQGYAEFKSLGCVSCHQGVNIGGNLYQRHGIFHPLASPKPEILRVPSLRNIAQTGPYFHDGSSKTLQDAVRRMGSAQLNSDLTDEQVNSIVAYLKALTGYYHGQKVGAPR